MASPVLPSSGVLSPLGLDAVRLAPGFWGDRATLNREVIIAHCQEWMEKEGWIGNFRGERPRRGREFSDSEIYKMLEAMAWADHPGLAELADTVAAAQEEDGYLNTRWSGDRYTDFEWGHELYCYGHLIQAGVARLRMHGEDRLTDVVRRAADHICGRFMDTTETCGHPVVEMALVELYRATGTERYLEMAQRFVERRGLPALGDITFGRAYFQDDLPVRRAEVFRGHAVRAVYLASGAVDVAVETGDTELLKAIEAQWERTIARRVHLTGGLGSRHSDEAFGDDYELPPDRAYAETCAGIGSIMLAHRLLLATGDVRYADLAERTMYNVLATSPALDGRSFFYSNPLQVRVPAAPPEGVNLGSSGGLRSPWFSVSCCPNNIARTLASLPAYVATSDAAGVQIHHYGTGEIRHGGLVLDVETRYPWSGEVTVRVVEGGDGRISLRVPPWATGATITHRAPGESATATGPGGDARVSREVEPGYAVVEGAWRTGDEIRLDLPMASRWTLPDRRIDALRGSAAVERGPLVYCAESVAGEPSLADVSVRPSTGHAGHAGHTERVVDGVVEIDVEVMLTEQGSDAWPYGSPRGAAPEPAVADVDADPQDGTAAAGTAKAVLRLVPYHRWGNRGPAAMRVWLPVSD
ncbi:glycoside hydrolase family 127 protein [Microtetraspora sp. AC03309]|uniref:glycoside hydrolase family 127 protein n=1 Tax=Microtetraspora sp. AC03309 TaxID=2779376 RepID=UPI001E4E2754|nr:beta-L-arabinofuranosidase domain-containing protein [Microtetraspora sp. AC03309]MCC5574890.1 glycoside hydrolase family 127 protein [Microtetraspora sp. AC03309]